MKDGTLPENSNAKTSTRFDITTGTVTTTFDTHKFRAASNLSVARTILHEAIHAYVVAIDANNGPEELEALLGPNWAEISEERGHKYISESFRTQIATSLTIFAKMNGQSIALFTSNFFDDIAWGGLTTDNNGNEYDFFKNTITDASKRERIKNTILIEQTGKNSNGYSKDQQGKDAGC